MPHRLIPLLLLITLSSCQTRTSASSTRCTSRSRGRDEVREFALAFREAFPDLGFGATADLIAEGDYVVGQWKGGGTHTGPAFDDLPVGGMRPGRGRTMEFTGTTIIKVVGRHDRRGGRTRRRRRPCSSSSA